MSFLPVFMTSIASVIIPYVCPVFHLWFEYPELPLLFLIVSISEGNLHINDPYVGHYMNFMPDSNTHSHIKDI
jgi:hypothetical protein